MMSAWKIVAPGVWLTCQISSARVKIEAVGGQVPVTPTDGVLPRGKGKMRPGAALQYLRYNNYLDLEEHYPKCAYYDLADLGKKVPNACCDPGSYPAGVQGPGEGGSVVLDDPLPTEHNNQRYTCQAHNMLGSTTRWVTTYLGCEDGDLFAGESCEVVVNSGWPISNATLAEAAWRMGTWESCNCGGGEADMKTPAAKYGPGPGCYVAISPHMTVSPKIARGNFAKVSGSCPKRRRRPRPSLVEEAVAGKDCSLNLCPENEEAWKEVLAEAREARKAEKNWIQKARLQARIEIAVVNLGLLKDSCEEGEELDGEDCYGLCIMQKEAWAAELAAAKLTKDAVREARAQKQLDGLGLCFLN